MMARCCFVFCEQSSLLDDPPPQKKRTGNLLQLIYKNKKKLVQSFYKNISQCWK